MDNINVVVEANNARKGYTQTYETIVLKPNVHDGVNVLTEEMFTKENAKYVIKWDYDLMGESITIPENCIISMEGGSFTNGTLVGQNTKLINESGDESLVSVGLRGSWKRPDAHVTADEEDLTINNHNQIQLANKVYDEKAFSGMGRVYLRKNIVDGKNILDETMMSEPNTIYIIQYDYDLDGETIEVPENCVLKFEGGSLKNGELVGNDTLMLNTNETESVLDNVTLGGTWKESSYDLVEEVVADKAPGNGMGRIILRKDKTFAEQLTQENTIYVIRYDFKLNEDVTIPANCVLQFEGGSLNLNNGNIKGQSTGIISSDYHIFKYDRKQHFIDGSWNIDFWKTAWFGVVPDGIITLDSNYEATFSGTDNYLALQTALDVAFKTTCKNVLVARGSYRISKGLNVGWYGQSFISIVSDYNCDITDWATNEANPVKFLYDGTEYAININGGYGTYIRGISVIGKNVGNIRKAGEGLYLIEDIIDRNTYKPNETKYSTVNVNNITTAYSSYAPYAGIVTDAYRNYDASSGYSLPELPAFLEYMPDTAYSVRVRLEHVSICGFVVGYGISLSQSVVMNEYFKTEKCFIFSNVYAVSISTLNGRNTIFRDCYFRGNYCCFTNNRFARSISANTPGIGYPLFDNCSFDHSFEIIEYNNEGCSAVFSRCYGEYIYSIGKTVSDVRKPYNLRFKDCIFLFKSKESSGSGVPSVYFNGAAEFIGCEFRSYDDSYIIPLSLGVGTLQNCLFKASKHGDFLYNKASSLVLVNNYSLCNSNEQIHTSIFNTSINSGEIYNRSSFIDYWGVHRQAKFINNYVHSNVVNGVANQQFDSQTGILSLVYNWYVYKKVNIVPGDILYPYNHGTNCFDTTIFMAIEVDASTLEAVTVKAMPISGYKVTDDGYTLNTSNINNVTSPSNFKNYWRVFLTRNVELHSPISVVTVNDNTITVKDDIDSYVSLGDSFEVNTAESPNIENSIILSKEGKTIGFESCTANKGVQCWVTKSYLESKFWGIFNSSGTYIGDTQNALIIKEAPYSYTLTVATSTGSNVIIKDNRGVSYGFILRDGTSKSIKLPKNTYVFYDCSTKSNITTVVLNEDKSITI